MLARTLEQVPIAGNYPIRRHHFDVFPLHHHEYFLRYHLPSMWKAVPKEWTDEKALWGHPSAWRVPLSRRGLWQGTTHFKNIKLPFYMSYNTTMWQCKCQNVSVTMFLRSSPRRTRWAATGLGTAIQTRIVGKRFENPLPWFLRGLFQFFNISNIHKNTLCLVHFKS